MVFRVTHSFVSTLSHNLPFLKALGRQSVFFSNSRRCVRELSLDAVCTGGLSKSGNRVDEDSGFSCGMLDGASNSTTPKASKVYGDSFGGFLGDSMLSHCRISMENPGKLRMDSVFVLPAEYLHSSMGIGLLP